MDFIPFKIQFWYVDQNRRYSPQINGNNFLLLYFNNYCYFIIILSQVQFNYNNFKNFINFYIHTYMLINNQISD